MGLLPHSVCENYFLTDPNFCPPSPLVLQALMGTLCLFSSTQEGLEGVSELGQRLELGGALLQFLVIQCP